VSVSEHLEWLSLIEVSGPFLAPSVLAEVFPQGLDAITTIRRQRLRVAYEEWCDTVDEGDPDIEEVHGAWVEMVLQETLEYEETVLSDGHSQDRLVHRVPEHGAQICPDYALNRDDKPCLFISVYPPDTDPERPWAGDGWPASPIERMTLLCRAHGVRLGLLTNGERWTLVNAPVGGTSGHASWYARLWWQEPVTLRAFIALLGVRRAFGPGTATLGYLIELSEDAHEEVTDTLGEQVRRAVEVLIQALGRADEDRQGELLADVETGELYEAGLTVMMRLVFVLCAEERDLLLLGDPVYDQQYAISTLRAQLREDEDLHGAEVLERRYDAWSRLLAVFRAVYGGIEHEALRMPPLGGSLFDPDRFPFLEGRTKDSDWRQEVAAPLPIDNRTVLLLLSALQVLEQHGGAQLLSYRALDVEQIGHVYEGLLEYTVTRLPNITLALIGSKKNPNPMFALEELEALQDKGTKALIDAVADFTGRSASAIRNALERGAEPGDVIHACGGNQRLAERLQPYAGLVRLDSWGGLLVYREGAFAVTSGSTRRETGTHYTPKSLTERIVATTLEPVAYEGPATGLDRVEWKLKDVKDLLDLKVCDPAMGSGAFLVQACRWLSERVVEAWRIAEKQGRVVASDGFATDAVDGAELIPESEDDRLLHARRLVAERCLYGVDINPLAVDLAKLSLWLVTLAKGRPFGFLDHNLRCGDSLLGVHRVDQLGELNMIPGQGERLLFSEQIEKMVKDATETRKKIRKIVIRDIQDVEMMNSLNESVLHSMEPSLLIADALVGAVLAGVTSWDVIQRTIGTQANALLGGDNNVFQELTIEAERNLRYDSPQNRKRIAFHWLLEFPEVFFQREGFDAIIGNPPFLGGQRITGAMGTAYRDYLVKVIAGNNRGSADLVAYFFLHAYALIRRGGCFGLLAVNTISEGDTRQVGLEPMVSSGAQIYEAWPNEVWPGRAAVVTSCVHICREKWFGKRYLSGVEADTISPFLSEREEWSPLPLAANRRRSFQGPIILGAGFTITEAEAQEFLEDDADAEDVLFPYLNGKDLNSHPEQKPSRWVICFWDWPLSRARKVNWNEVDEQTRNTWLSEGIVPENFPGYVASDFPQLLASIEQNVKPERSKNKDRLAREKWWRFLRPRPELFHEIGRGSLFFSHPSEWKDDRTLSRVLCCARVSKYLAFSWQNLRTICSDATIVFASDSAGFAGVLTSTIHTEWAWRNASRLKRDIRYTPTDCFETFPFPIINDKVVDLGEKFLAFRSEIMCSEEIGLTNFYNRFHDIEEQSEGIKAVRQLQIDIDEAVILAYGWKDIELGHDFYEVEYLPENDRIRFTMSNDARTDVMRRLSALNCERYQAEQEQAQKSDNRPPTSRPKSASTRRSPRKEIVVPDAEQLQLDVPSEKPQAGSAIDEYHVDGIMQAFRQAARATGVTTRYELMKAAAYALDFGRFTSGMEERLRNHLRAAIRRKIIATDGGDQVWLATPTMDSYEWDDLEKTVYSVMKKDVFREYEEIVREVAEHLGFERLAEAVSMPVKKTLNRLVRNGTLEKKGSRIRRLA
jgi:hypothetical protein